MKKGILKGYYGYGNFGDDLFLYFFTKYILPLFQEYVFIIPIVGTNLIPKEVMTHNKNIILEIYYYNTRARRIVSKGKLLLRYLEAELLIYGGGTFLYEATGLKNMKTDLRLLDVFLSKGNRSVIGIGIGVDPINDPLMLRTSKKILDKFSYIIFRDSFSQKNAERITGSSIKDISIILPDLAYGLVNDVKIFTEGVEQIPRSIGINFMLPLNCTDKSSYISSMRDFVTRLIRDKFDIYIIVAQPSLPYKEIRLVSEIMPNFPSDRIIYYSSDIESFFKKISSLEVIIGSRLHVLIAAHMLQKPFFNIEYQEKTRYFMQEINYEENSLTYNDMSRIYEQIVNNKIKAPKISAYELYNLLMRNLVHVLKRELTKC